ncbi:MAG: hypothetical protein U1E33_00855 [Rhodospirillales bacterium]
MNRNSAAGFLGSRLTPLCEAWEDAVEVLSRGFSPLLDLGVRLWLAQIFFVSGVLKTANWDVTIFLYARASGAGARPGYRCRPRRRHRAGLPAAADRRAGNAASPPFRC